MIDCAIERSCRCWISSRQSAQRRSPGSTAAIRSARIGATRSGRSEHPPHRSPRESTSETAIGAFAAGYRAARFATACRSRVEPAEPEKSFEERFGTRWVVWIGGLALALGGIFLVQYSIEAGLIGPRRAPLLRRAARGRADRRRRIHAASATSGERHCRRSGRAHPEHSHRGRHHRRLCDDLRGLRALRFPRPGTAFLLLGVVALATLAAALLHGPALAALGLIGAFVTPVLVVARRRITGRSTSISPSSPRAALSLARARLWRWLAVTAVVFGLAWMLPGVQDSRVDALGAHLFHVLAGFALVAALIVSGLLYGPDAEPGGSTALLCGALALSVRRAAAGAGEPPRPVGLDCVRAAAQRQSPLHGAPKRQPARWPPPRSSPL